MNESKGWRWARSGKLVSGPTFDEVVWADEEVEAIINRDIVEHPTYGYDRNDYTVTQLYARVFHGAPEEIEPDTFDVETNQIEVDEAMVERAAQAISRRHLSNSGVPFPVEMCRGDARVALYAALKGV